MTLHVIKILNRNYDSYTILNSTTMDPILINNINPLQEKLLNEDIFTFNKGKVEIISSPIRSNDNIAAVLIIENNKTYGRENKTLVKQGKLLYKCIPNDPSLPIFLVPYEIQKIGFSKVLTNLYVTIRFKNWNEKHPYAILSQTLGPVDILANFYEYQLYCKNLFHSNQNFNKTANKIIIKTSDKDNDSLINNIFKYYSNIEDRTSWKIFSIDPQGSVDFDDAFSIKKIENNQILLSIYISNVSLWIDFLNLWDSFSERISTIYLPNRKISMLPNILSDCLCSLQEKCRRFAFTMDIILDSNFTIYSIQYKNCLIKVFKNFIYEDSILLSDSDYKFLFSTALNILPKYKYIESIDNSHDLVAYFMIFMNYHCSKELLQHHNGIFRATSSNNKTMAPETLPSEVTQFLKILSSNSGKYIDYQNQSCTNILKHEMLQLDSYIHITSPIRRIVDLLNIIQIQHNLSLTNLSTNSLEFYQKWCGKIDYINIAMRKIRQVQNDCNLLHLIYNNQNVLEKIYIGIIFDKLITLNGLYQFTAYIPDLKITSKIIVSQDFENYTQHQLKLFIFNNEEKFKKKIRLQLINT
uniref:RNB domain-containing protein n=1 Tax=viral metagenome TaxID=1070528 RepID=A0A6C0KMZ2_9ZZZZ